jgi:hypothetical protein
MPLEGMLADFTEVKMSDATLSYRQIYLLLISFSLPLGYEPTTPRIKRLKSSEPTHPQSSPSELLGDLAWLFSSSFRIILILSISAEILSQPQLPRS